MTTGPAHFELLARARATDNQCYVATVSPARDTKAGYVAWGHSALVNPWYESLVVLGILVSLVFPLVLRKYNR